MGLYQKFLTRAGSAIFGLGLGLENPLKITHFSIFFPYVKNYLGQRWVGLLFNAGQKFAWVSSSQVSELVSFLSYYHTLIFLDLLTNFSLPSDFVC